VFLPGATPAERDAFVRYQRHAGRAAVAARSLAAVYAADVRAEAARLTVPTLVLHRRDDRAIPFRLGRELGALIPGATFQPLPGEDHFPWRGDWASVARAVLDFLGVPDHDDPDDGTPPAAVIGELTERELDVLRLVAAGLSDREIAQRLVLSPHTVHRHVANIRTKLGLPSRAAAAAYATRIGVI
jgi:DNA-binding CsgD family transcriptional regulator